MEDNQSYQIDLNFNSLYQGELRILKYLAFQKNGLSTFQDVIKNTGISERSAWRYLRTLQERNILVSHRAKETIISFVDRGTWMWVKEATDVISRHWDIGYRNKQ